jgi:signal transduction histidine kinase
MRRFGDLALATAVFAGLSADAASQGNLEGGTALNLGAFGVLASTFAWRRLSPVGAAVVCSATLFALTAFLTPLPELQTAQAALALAAYLAAAATAGRGAVIAFASFAAAVSGSLLVYGAGNLGSRQIYALVTITSLAWLAGRAARGGVLLNSLLREKAAALERERDERARDAARAMRRQIARELHDVIAHSLTVMIVQAGSARRIAAERPEEAVDAAGLIEATGRKALAEMRQLLRVMGDEATPPLSAPPGIDSLETLIASTRAAGLPVELRRDGDTRPLPAGVDMAAYRIVQEALTNSIKHADASRAELVVRYRPDELELLVVDDGQGPPPRQANDGHGLDGMRERVRVFGGALETGPAEDGGFRVSARIPLEDHP